jgi:hypothetical protein
LPSAPDGYVALRILSAFRRQAGAAGVEYKFVLSGIQNPMDTLESSSFQFFTFTGNGYPIDVYTTGTTIKML